MKLPREIRYQIFELLFEQHGSLTRESLNSVNLFGVDPSIRQPLHRLFSGYVDELGPLLYFDDIQEYQNEVKDFLGYKCHFIIPRVEWLYKMPKAFGRNNCEMIRHLTIRMEDCVQYKHERMWPASLELLTDGFLYLRYFEMYTETPEIATPYPECGDDVDLTVSQKCLRSLLRFIAFAVLRHNNQDRAIFPANSTDHSLIPSYIIHRVFAEKARAFNPGGPLKKWNSMQDSNTSQVREVSLCLFSYLFVLPDISNRIRFSTQPPFEKPHGTNWHLSTFLPSSCTHKMAA